MSRSVADLRYELKTHGRVAIPRATAGEIISPLSLALVPAALAGVIWWRSDLSAGPLIAIIMLIVAAVVIVVWTIRDLRKRVVASPTDLHMAGHRPIPWEDIEKIGVPAVRSILSIQLTPEGFLRYFRQSESDDDARAFLSNAQDRVVIWSLAEPVSENELRFLREQISSES